VANQVRRIFVQKTMLMKMIKVPQIPVLISEFEVAVKEIKNKAEGKVIIIMLWIEIFAQNSVRWLRSMVESRQYIKNNHQK